jgi:hypothetical protein
MAQIGLLGNRVVPVVEPIKLTSTFTGTIKLYVSRGNSFALILNPAVGELSRNATVDLILPYISGSVIPSILVDKTTSDVMTALSAINISEIDILAIMTNRDYLDAYREMFSNTPPKYTLFHDERQIRRAIRANKVMFENKFKKQEKNADYLKQEDEFFSDDHLYFRDEGFLGFGDYSIIGDEYIENGFAPYAVAIHIIYFASDDTLRVRHFVSDSNTDIKDVAGKYYEAVTKLKRWYDSGQTRQRTNALSTLLSHAENGYYPGLPTIKKLSIMHHLELVGKYLDGGLEK